MFLNLKHSSKRRQFRYPPERKRQVVNIRSDMWKIKLVYIKSPISNLIQLHFCFFRPLCHQQTVAYKWLLRNKHKCNQLHLHSNHLQNYAANRNSVNAIMIRGPRAPRGWGWGEGRLRGKSIFTGASLSTTTAVAACYVVVWFTGLNFIKAKWRFINWEQDNLAFV